MLIINNIDDLTLDLYLKIVQSKDLKHLLKNKALFVGESELKQAWEQINEEVLSYTGLTDKQQFILEKQRELTLLMIEITANDNEELLTQFNIEQKRLEEIVNNGKQEDETGDIFYYIALLEKFLTFQIDKKNTSVRQWLAYNKLFNESIKHGRKSTTE
jgi:hypothetical protein